MLYNVMCNAISEYEDETQWMAIHFWVIIIIIIGILLVVRQSNREHYSPPITYCCGNINSYNVKCMLK